MADSKVVVAASIHDPEDFQVAAGFCEHSDCDDQGFTTVTYSAEYEHWYCAEHIARVRAEMARIARREAEEYRYVFGDDDTDPAGYEADWERVQAAMEEGGMFDGQGDPAPTLEDEIADAAEAYRQASLKYAVAQNNSAVDNSVYLAAYGAMKEGEAALFALLAKKNG